MKFDSTDDIYSLCHLTGRSAFCDRSTNVLSVAYTVHIRFARYTSVTHRQSTLVDRSLSVTWPLNMRYLCVLCAPNTFREDPHRQQDSFHHQMTT